MNARTAQRIEENASLVFDGEGKAKVKIARSWTPVHGSIFCLTLTSAMVTAAFLLPDGAILVGGLVGFAWSMIAFQLWKVWDFRQFAQWAHEYPQEYKRWLTREVLPEAVKRRLAEVEDLDD